MTTTSNAKPIELGVTNFGPISKANIELRQLTVFVGPSNTGKSYLAGLIYALHNFFKDDSRKVSFLHAREVTSYSDILTSLQESNLSESNCNLLFEWFMEVFPNLIADHALARGEFDDVLLDLPHAVAECVRPYLKNAQHWNENLDRELARCLGSATARKLVRYPSEGLATISLRGNSAPVRPENLGYDVEVSTKGIEIDASIPAAMPFQIGGSTIVRRLPLRWQMNPFLVRDEPKRSFAISLLVVLADEIASRNIDPFNRPAHYLPADRAGIMHAHQAVIRSLISSASQPSRLLDSSGQILSGVLGDFLDQLVSLAGHSVDSEGELAGLAQQLEHIVLQGDVRIESSEVKYPSFVYRPSGWDRDLGLMNSSSMVSELAPLVLYLRHVVRPDDLLIIEEPEAHLHPEMQAKFTRLLVAAVQSGIRILITTHSEWILEELANLVRLSDLPVERREGIENPEISLNPNQLSTWFFEPNVEAGGSVVREISLDEEMATFPAGFGLVTESLYNRWVEISTRIQEGN